MSALVKRFDAWFMRLDGLTQYRIFGLACFALGLIVGYFAFRA